METKANSPKEEENRQPVIDGPTNPMVMPLLSDLYQFTMAYAYWKADKHNERAVKENMQLSLTGGRNSLMYVLIRKYWIFSQYMPMSFLFMVSMLKGKSWELMGIVEELVTLLGRHSPIPVTYAGGVTVMSDLERIKSAGMERVDVTVGSALDIFGGNLAYKDFVAWHAQQEALAV